MTESQSEVKESLIVDDCAHYREATVTRSEVPALKDLEEAKGWTIAPSKLLTAYEKKNGGVRGLNKRTQFLDTTYIGEVPLITSPWDRSQDVDMFSGGGHSSSSESKDGDSGNEQKSGGNGGFVLQSYPIPERDTRPSGDSDTNESKESKESKDGADHEAKGIGDSKDGYEGKSSTEMKSEGKNNDYTPSSRDYK